LGYDFYTFYDISFIVNNGRVFVGWAGGKEEEFSMIFFPPFFEYEKFLQRLQTGEKMVFSSSGELYEIYPPRRGEPILL